MTAEAPIAPRLGLVLAGGGAKGAYQAGAVACMAEFGIEPEVIAGTSIGALNGAVLACHPPMRLAADLLGRMWERLAEEDFLKPSAAVLAAAAKSLGRLLAPDLVRWLDHARSVLGGGADGHGGYFDPRPLEALLRASIDPVRLGDRPELWATVFPSLGVPGWATCLLTDFVRAAAGVEAHWIRIQDLRHDPEAVYDLLLASAAIPLAFPCRSVDGQTYVDGGLRDNVPIRALIRAGCSHAIVIHLSNGSIWSRDDFPEIQIIEIRPRLPIQRSETPLIGALDSLFDFSSATITTLRQQGYADSKYYLSDLAEGLKVEAERKQSLAELHDQTLDLIRDPPILSGDLLARYNRDQT